MVVVDRLREQLAASYTRALLWVETSAEQRLQQVEELVTRLNYPVERTILLSDTTVAGIEPVRRGEFVRYLGGNYDLIIVDCFAGLNPATLAQAAGTLEGGGTLILLTPPAEAWTAYPDPEYTHIGVSENDAPGRFIHWLINSLVKSPAVLRFRTEARLADRSAHAALTGVGVYRGAEQQAAVYTLLRNWSQTQSCTVLDADRGRGKSSSLGLALALQSSFTIEQIALCAPDSRATASLLRRFCEVAPERTPPRCLTPAHLLERLEKQPGLIKCVLVDEAAGVPVQVLQKLVNLVPHLVLASTQHGYEGLSKGYGLRFLRELEVSHPVFTRVQLSEPLRWASGDPLEAWVERYLLLDDSGEDALDAEGLQEVDRDQLICDPDLLQQIYSLLAQAHYRTSPADLRVLLDAPQQRLFRLSQAGHLLAVLWLVEEGPLEAELAEKIMQGRRRPKGNLLPQSLLHYKGWATAAHFRYWRIVRIAVAEPMRRAGLATGMLQQLEEWATDAGVDFLGASFAGHAELVRFWRSAGFRVVREGESLDPVAAAPAVQVLRAVSARAQAVVDQYASPQVVVDDTALRNFAHHFAPLSLVRESLLERYSETQEPLILALASEQALTSAQVRRLRRWLAARLES